MSALSLVSGTVLILMGLWHRDRERLSVALFIAGALLVVVAGVLAAPAFVAAD
jgi:hypothetical protein